MHKVIRAGVVLLKEDKILVVKSRYSTGEFYLLPGGGIEGFETIEEAAIREVREETNLHIGIKKLLYVKEWIDKRREKNVVDMIFLGTIIDGEMTHRFDPSFGKGHIISCEWIGLYSLAYEMFYPKDLVAQIIKDKQTHFMEGAVYLPPEII
jgi:8-oxo-dGTP diphosphatase